MTEQVRELLSVLMDGEASEIEIHRLLRQMRDGDSLNAVWVSYQETRRVLRRPSKNRTESEFQLSIDQHLDLHRSISAAISVDRVYHGITTDDAITSTNGEDKPNSSNKFFKPAAAFRPATAFRPAAALAIAASLVVAVFVGLQVNSPEGNDVASETSATQSNPVEVQFISNEISVASELVTGNEPIVENLELKELDEEGQRRLRAYLNRHDRMARMKSNTQLVIYPKRPDR